MRPGHGVLRYSDVINRKAAMRLSRQQNTDAPLIRHGHPGDLWHTMACLRAAHPDPVGIDEPFEPTAARLSIARPEDIVLSARVELFEDETVSRLHDVIDTVTRDLDGAKGFGAYALVPDVALEAMIGVRQELPLHTAERAGLGGLGASSGGVRRSHALRLLAAPAGRCRPRPYRLPHPW